MSIKELFVSFKELISKTTNLRRFRLIPGISLLQRIENHHIFSREWCKQQRIPRWRYNSIVNKTPLTAKTNKFLGGKAPSEYLAKLEEQGLSSNGLMRFCDRI
jgi:hypothetical protein